MRLRGLDAEAVPWLVRLASVPGASAAVRLELAEALFHAGRFEEGLGVNYSLDSLAGELGQKVLIQRRDFFLLLGMEEEVTKVETRLALLPPGRPAGRSPWIPHPYVQLSIGINRLSQGAEQAGLKTLLDQWSEGSGQDSGVGIYSASLEEKVVTQGDSRGLAGGLAWGWSSGGTELRLRAGAVQGARLADLSMTSYGFDVLGEVGRGFGASQVQAFGRWTSTQYVTETRWWSRAWQAGLQVGSVWRDADLSGAASVTRFSTRSRPDGYLSWEAQGGVRRTVPGWKRLELGIHGSVEAHWLPSVVQRSARVTWASGLSEGLSNHDAGIVHYADSAGTMPVVRDPFKGTSELTYHARDVLQRRWVYSQYTPGLGGDLQLQLPWGLAATGGASVAWTRSIGKVAWNNAAGAASEGGALLLWRDVATGRDYVFADAVEGSPLIELRVREQERVDLTRSLSCGLSWSSRLWGSLSVSSTWTWGEVDPAPIDPSAAYRAWSLAGSWSRSW